jgi:hypothetical protein
MIRLFIYLTVLLLSAGCNILSGLSEYDPQNENDSSGGDTDTTVKDDTSGWTPMQFDTPLCVWNQAYQENYDPDSIGDILAEAENCYVLLDVFSSSEARDAVAPIKKKNNIVGCYMSVGTCEDWRDDYAEMKPYCVETGWNDWDGEYFVNETTEALKEIMFARIDKMAALGCDMVEFDNMDWALDDEYRTKFGFAVTGEESIWYYSTLCDHVHGKGMGCMAKSTAEGASNFDGGTFESYPEEMDWWEHDYLQEYLDAGKLGVVVHYAESDCSGILATYQKEYGDKVSFICEDNTEQGYLHF